MDIAQTLFYLGREDVPPRTQGVRHVCTKASLGGSLQPSVVETIRWIVFWREAVLADRGRRATANPRGSPRLYN